MSEQRSTAELLSDCVHCGFCLPACPTYQSWGAEADSPRGRIDLMKGVHEGVIALDQSVSVHIDACLGCMACVTACPSGVRYDLLLESTRASVETTVPRTPFDRAFRALIFALFPFPTRLRALAVPLVAYVASGAQRIVRRSGLLRRLSPSFAALDALMPAVTLRVLRQSVPRFTPASGPRRASVALIEGCVQRVFFPKVNAATVRVLAAEGCDVRVPRKQGCCGALSLHAGRSDEAKAFARALIARFEGEPVDTIVVNAAGCGSTLKTYDELLADDPAFAERARAFSAKVRDVNEVVADLEPRATRHPFPARVAYHDACHLAHAQHVRAQPRAILRGIPQLELIEIPQGDMCCGSAGTYNLFAPEAAHEIGVRKAENVQSVAPDLLASANPGCTLQIAAVLRERGATIAAAHPIEILDASLAGRTTVDPGGSA